MKPKVLTYHCQLCGAPVEPGTQCKYCGSKTSYRRNSIMRSSMQKIRVFSETPNGQRFYFHNIFCMSYKQNPQIEYCLNSSGYCIPHILSRASELSFDAFYNMDLYNKVAYLKKTGECKLYIENVIDNSVKQLEGYLTEHSVSTIDINSVLSVGLNFIATKDVKVINADDISLPKMCNCPNCGAELNKIWGTCDYCGGWNEYRDIFI